MGKVLDSILGKSNEDIENSATVGSVEPDASAADPASVDQTEDDKVVATAKDETSGVDETLNSCDDQDDAITNSGDDEAETCSDMEAADEAADEAVADINTKSLIVRRPTTLYRTPSDRTAITAVSGPMAVLGDPVNGFIPVSCVAIGHGRIRGYIRKN